MGDIGIGFVANRAERVAREAPRFELSFQSDEGPVRLLTAPLSDVTFAFGDGVVEAAHVSGKSCRVRHPEGGSPLASVLQAVLGLGTFVGQEFLFVDPAGFDE